MVTAHLDFETYSPVDLKSAGLSRYANHPEADVLCLAYALDDGPVKVWTPDMPMPVELFRADYYTAHNAAFERTIWWRILYQGRYRWPDCPPLDRWHCSMALGQSFGLPGGLDDMAAALRSPIRKGPRGKALIQFFCVPDRKTGKRRLPMDHPAEFKELCDYCAQDVEAERAIVKLLPRQELSAKERMYWQHQMRVNDRGIGVDLATTQALYKAVAEVRADLSKRAKALTGGIDSTRRDAIMTWLREEEFVDTDNLRALTIKRLLEDMPESKAKELLEIRAAASKVSTKKYTTLLQRVSSDHRLRHSMVYHGASTGRVTHRGFQTGNMPRGEIKQAWELAEDLGLISDPSLLSLFHDPMQAYSGLVRSMLVASVGKALYSGDYAQIEARYNAYFSGQHDLVKRFALDEDVYREMAARIYRMLIELIYKDSRQRFIGKQVTLAAGFGIGPDGFRRRCKETWDVDVSQEEAENAISTFRETFPAIVQTWYAVAKAAQGAVMDPGKAYEVRGATYVATKDGNWLFCKLASGRVLAYLRPRVVTDKQYNRPKLLCAGVNTYTHKWSEEINLWHGTLVENIVQASCRDIMVDAALRLENAGFRVVLTVHDEVVSEADKERSLEDYLTIMKAPVAWAPGLPIKVEGWTGRRYRK